jgi:hypothetical protein
VWELKNSKKEIFAALKAVNLICNGPKCKLISVSDRTADVVDVVYVTWSVGCLGVGEAARGEQFIANQGQEWMGICTMSKRSRISK